MATTKAANATAFIAHRLDLPGHPFPVPAHVVDDAKDERSQKDCGHFRVTQANAADGEYCLRSLAQRPLGVELSASSMYEMRCERNIWMVALNRNFAGEGAVAALAARKMLLAVIARRDSDTGLYAAAFVVFSAPDAAGAHLLVHRVDGGLLSAGRVRMQDGIGSFALWPVKGPRPYTVSIEGQLERGRLAITTAMATRGEKRNVLREHRQLELRGGDASYSPGA